MPEEYLPDELRGQRFYEPSGSGEEAQIRERLAKWREELFGAHGNLTARLAARR